MRSWGVWIIVLAVLSAVLPYFGLQFILLSWVDSWGVGVGWAIRGGLVVLGLLMAAFGGDRDE